MIDFLEPSADPHILVITLLSLWFIQSMTKTGFLCCLLKQCMSKCWDFFVHVVCSVCQPCHLQFAINQAVAHISVALCQIHILDALFQNHVALAQLAKAAVPIRVVSNSAVSQETTLQIKRSM